MLAQSRSKQRKKVVRANIIKKTTGMLNLLWRLEKQIDSINQHSRLALSHIRKILKRSGAYQTKLYVESGEQIKDLPSLLEINQFLVDTVQ